MALTTITGADPAAGAEALVTVPANELWVPKAIRFTLVTSASVANRVPQVIIDDGTNELWSWRFGTAQTATLTRTYRCELGVITELDRSSVLEMYAPIGDHLVLSAGYRIRTVTAAIQGTDDYGTPFVVVDRSTIGKATLS